MVMGGIGDYRPRNNRTKTSQTFVNGGERGGEGEWSGGILVNSQSHLDMEIRNKTLSYFGQQHSIRRKQGVRSTGLACYGLTEALHWSTETCRLKLHRSPAHVAQKSLINCRLV